MNLKFVIYFIIINFLTASTLFGQFDIKIDPASALAGRNFKGGIEVGIDDLFAIDADLFYSPSVYLPFTGLNTSFGKAYGFRIIGKFYPYPKYKLDAFYIGPYAKYRHSKSKLYTHNRIAIGFMSGYKILLPRKLYLEFGTGLGLRVHATLKNNLGEFIDGLTDANFFGNVYNYFADGIGRYDLTTRLAIGYRISGDGPKTKKQKAREKIITP